MIKVLGYIAVVIVVAMMTYNLLSYMEMNKPCQRACDQVYQAPGFYDRWEEQCICLVGVK